jgi:hypothetical protein
MQKINFVVANNCGAPFFHLCLRLGIAAHHKHASLPEQPFVYEYEHFWWTPTEEFFDTSTGGFLKNPVCPENVLTRIRNKTAYLVITLPMESYVFERHLYHIHKFFKNLDLPASNVIYFTCSPNANELYKDYCTQIFDIPRATFKYFPYYFDVYNQAAAIKEVDYKIEPKKKAFLMFNRRWWNHPHRVLFLYHCVKEKIIDKFHISFSKYEIDNGRSYTSAIQSVEQQGVLENFVVDQSILDKVESLLPLTLDSSDLTQNLMFSEFDTTESFYETSFVHITSETYFFSDIIHITEKSFKPILYKQPFIVLAAPNFLASLRELGFKTFSDIWDESYDTEKNHTKRFYMILALIKEINSFDDATKLKIADKIKDIVDYNHNQLLNFSGNNLVKSLTVDFNQ